ncbi:hypothetical protein LTR56_012694 [Elasticomyces elasticus]|nr:hypothetical protein LTR22_022673 [Elasticomyces elasticus]KAK3638971.1 hypothetical protein LTR56_012694 [Elasticomyces elasticus]KAK4918776.1 hypothetical protein LTR49_013563 [Elasticomyces elasticus]KAK5754396.1 hypothetical protein LTS12_015465 [Elasticomyces elasticus]
MTSTTDDRTPLPRMLLALKQIFIEAMERFLYINPLHFNNSMISAPSVLAMLGSTAAKVKTVHIEDAVKLANIYAVFRLARLWHSGRFMPAFLLTINFVPCSEEVPLRYRTSRSGPGVHDRRRAEGVGAAVVCR